MNDLQNDHTKVTIQTTSDVIGWAVVALEFQYASMRREVEEKYAAEGLDPSNNNNGSALLNARNELVKAYNLTLEEKAGATK